MTPLRQRMIREMQLRQLSPRTIDCYIDAVAALAKFYKRSPDHIQREEVRSYLHHLLVDRHLAQSTCHVRAAAITFLYQRVLGQHSFDLGMRRKHSGKLPEVYSQEELVRLFEAAANLQPIWSQPRVKVSSFAEAQAASKNRLAAICAEVDLRAPE